MDDWKVIGDIAGSLTGTGALIYALYAVITGKVKTGEHHKEVVDTLEASEKRAWGMVNELTEARSQDNLVMEKLAESIRSMNNTVSALRSTIENQRSRR